ncbi:hypothetical protein N9J72_02015 [Candidatus Gracilibacteria bacterium]|nr:hypothetical protein [Candidatus Gracilibacteria bacterium]
MSKNTCDHRDFPTLYKALNKGRITDNKSFECTCGKTVNYEFYGSEIVKNDTFLSGFSAFLWVAPALFMIVICLFIGLHTPIVFLYAIAFVIVYHFAGMYYVTQHPMLILTEEKRGFFGR